MQDRNKINLKPLYDAAVREEKTNRHLAQILKYTQVVTNMLFTEIVYQC